MPGDINYLPASYKGVPFTIEESDDTVGRRGKSYEFPERDTPDYLDLGKKAITYSLTGYVYGDTHLLQANAMAAACQSFGPGPLVHPTFGVVQVACVSLKIKTSYKEKKRRTEFTFEFIEAGSYLGGVGSGIPLLDYALSVWPAFLTTMIAYSDNQLGQLSDRPETITSEFSRLVTSVHDELAGSDLTKSGPVFARLETSAGDYSTLKTASFASLMNDGMNAVRLYSTDAFSRLVNVATAATITVGTTLVPDSNASIGFSPNFAALVPGYDPESGLVREALNSMYMVTRLMALGNAGLASRKKKYATLFEAISDLDVILKGFDQETQILSQMGSNEEYAAAAKLRAAIIADMIKNNIGLPGIIFRQMGRQLPSLVMAYELYGDAKRAEELEKYNANFSAFALGPDLWGAST